MEHANETIVIAAADYGIQKQNNDDQRQFSTLIHSKGIILHYMI